MINRKDIKAILCARGGYGAVRIIDQLDFSPLKKYPKWIIGYSDITVFHSHLHAHAGMASLHAKMTEGFPTDPSLFESVQLQALDTIRRALFGEPLQYSVPASTRNRLGEVEGILIGGNLKIIETLSATNSDIDTRNKIFFVEDVGEALYSIDRMFCNLKRSGKLSHLKALIVGSFSSIRPDDPQEPFGKTIYDIVWEQVKEFNYPVCFDFSVGHQKNNVALKCGVPHQLVVGEQASVLTQIQAG
jgi:muramoyltetrapeptide carboxypeptidase